MPEAEGGIRLKIQQISRFRLGGQGRDDGYQTAGISQQVSAPMESEFTGMYTTIRLSEELESLLPYVLDCGYDINGTYFYMTQIYAGKDSQGRPTPYCHGIILDDEQMDRYFSEPEDFFRFDKNNFMDYCNPMQKGKQSLPEIEMLQLESREMTVEAIRSKYHLTDAVYEDLLRHMYEVVYSEGKTTLSFGWDQPFDTYTEVIKDMMFLAFNAMPMVLRKKITFSNYQIPGMSSRMFTVVPERKCESGKSAWFNLTNFHSSPLQEDTEGTRYKTQYIGYLASMPEEKVRSFIKYVDGFLYEMFKHPEMKMVTTIGNVMVPAFFSYEPRIVETYFRPTNAARIMNTIVRVKVDASEKMADIAGALLDHANSIGAQINDVQFKNLQKYYLDNDSRVYGKAFISALATRDINTVKKLFGESLKEKSNLKTDNFIAELLTILSEETDILTEKVVTALADRYPITESEELQDFYLNYVNSLYSKGMSQEEASKLIKKAIEFIKENKNLPFYERAAIYMQRQLVQLKKYKLVLQDDVLQQLLQICVEYANDYDIGDTIIDYYMDVYMHMPEYEAIRYYDYLMENSKDVVRKVNKRLRKEESKLQDRYYVQLHFPRISGRIKSVDDYQTQLKTIHSFPVFEDSENKIFEFFEETLKSEMVKRTSEERATDKKMAKKVVDGSNDLLFSNGIIYDRYCKAIKKINELYSEDSPKKTELQEKIKNVYWEMVDVDSISREFFNEKLPEVEAQHIKCENIKKYWTAYDEFANGITVQEHYRPSVDIINALTTTECLGSRESIKNRIDSCLKKCQMSNDQLSFDILLIRYYDFEKDKFKETEFLENLTDEQIEEYQEFESYMPEIHPSIKAELNKFFRKKKKNNENLDSRSRKKKLFFLIGGIAVVVVLIAVIILAVVFIKKGGKNQNTEETIGFEEIQDDRNSIQVPSTEIDQ